MGKQIRRQNIWFRYKVTGQGLGKTHETLFGTVPVLFLIENVHRNLHIHLAATTRSWFYNYLRSSTLPRGSNVHEKAIKWPRSWSKVPDDEFHAGDGGEDRDTVAFFAEALGDTGMDEVSEVFGEPCLLCRIWLVTPRLEFLKQLSNGNDR